MSTLLEIYRHTFPKRLRFDKASQVLYAQCYSVAKQYKHKKYIPRREIQQVLDAYEPMPGAPWLQMPIIRHVLLVRLVSGVRGYCGRRMWLYNRSVEEEYAKLSEWLAKSARTPAGRRSTTGGLSSSSASANSSSVAGAAGASDRATGSRLSSAAAAAQSKLEGMVERERFEREVLMNFHVATVYQRMFRLGVAVALCLALVLYASLHTDQFVYWYLVYYCRYGRQEVMEFFREITLRHTATEVPPAYASLLPPPCVQHVDAAGDVTFAVNMVEMTMPDRNVTVFAIPCPQMGGRAFFEKVGEVASVCDSVVLEGVSFSRVDKLAPAMFFPLKEDTFPVLGLHHRFLDVLRSSAAEPPMLYPAGADIGWRATIMNMIIPYELRCVYNPTELSATKGEARVGWGRLRQLIEDVGETLSGSASQERHVICVPWTMNQIVNLEASLVKYGFTVRNVYPLDWLREDHMGERFCAYYNVV